MREMSAVAKQLWSLRSRLSDGNNCSVISAIFNKDVRSFYAARLASCYCSASFVMHKYWAVVCTVELTCNR